MNDFPRIFRLRQQFDVQSINDIPSTVSAELQRAGVPQRVRPGQTVAITAGSRGISNIVTILRSVVGFLRELDAEPFLIPAMGSHGGATAEAALFQRAWIEFRRAQRNRLRVMEAMASCLSTRFDRKEFALDGIVAV